MFGTLRTLVLGGQARAEEAVKDVFAIELIDQHIRETENGLNRAKIILAQMIQREKTDTRVIAKLSKDRKDLEARIKAALKDGNETLAQEAAQALARMENEGARRTSAVNDLRDRLARLRLQVDAQNRKLIDLKQGAQMARAVKADQAAYKGVTPTSSAREAEDLIAKVCGSKDPFEFDSILDDINADLSGENLTDRMAAQGYGPSTKSTADDIIARLSK